MYFDIFGLFLFSEHHFLVLSFGESLWTGLEFTVFHHYFRVHHPKVTLYPLSYGKSLYDFVSSGFT